MVPLSIEHQNQNWCSELFNQQMTAQTWNGRIAQSMSLYWCLINEMNGTWWTVQRTSIWEQQGLCTVLALLFVMIICLALFYIFILGCKLFEAWKLPFFWTVIKYFRSVLFFFVNLLELFFSCQFYSPSYYGTLFCRKEFETTQSERLLGSHGA